MKISIIIPTYQEENAIEKTLQQFSERPDDIELVVSDGGSADRTVDIAKKYTKKVAVHDTPTRQNIAQGRNAGARIASGDILVFLDADVTLKDKEAFFEELRYFGKTKKQYMAARIYVDPLQASMKDKLFHTYLNMQGQVCAFLGCGLARGECQVFRKDFFEKIGGYNPLLSASEDYEICLRAMKQSRMYFSRKAVGYESGRRYRSYGYPKTVWLWVRNAWEVSTKKKSYSPEWEPVR